MFRIVTAYAKNSKLANIHPYEKAAFCIIPILIIGFTRSILMPAINILVFIALHIISKNPLKLVLKFVLGILGFALMSSVTFVFDYGIGYCLIVLLKCLSGGLAVTYLAFTTPIDDLLYVISKNENLRDICDIAKSMQRFLILIEDEFFILHSAVKARGGFDDFKSKVLNSGKVAGLLFINTFRRWKEIKEAINSRCYRGHTCYFHKNFSSSTKRRFAIFLYNLILLIICVYKEW
ncbi:cobalt ABC transporter permease [Fervidicella metallireducens AeB]|uniref:Cobalt ABC transporter permease n=1 Tax=Fervidicella metallireducens AeB TaxID=1403537 RepID=A0A017RWR5_9CLOT|nr:cobalt ECF transporter T component CbiQ [Fervidicella metallireducens]EYE89218.1 cobalt ABC transporter permease [Fervidicella metallireducens AeB]